MERPHSGYGHYVWDGGWVLSTEARDPDGGTDGYGCMGTVSGAKNILSIGAVDDLPGGFSSSEEVTIASYSAFGPIDDGRIKPDLMASGTGLWSTYNRSNTDYRNSSGTNMSAPNVTGSLALLQEWSLEAGEVPCVRTLKALVLHTADDLESEGPGQDGLGAAEHPVRSRPDGGVGVMCGVSLPDGRRYGSPCMPTGKGRSLSPCAGRIPPGNVPLPALNPDLGNLVNDLDLRLVPRPGRGSPSLDPGPGRTRAFLPRRATTGPTTWSKSGWQTPNVAFTKSSSPTKGNLEGGGRIFPWCAKDCRQSTWPRVCSN
ncbi:MAG: S8 family serine peptidase [Bacteroidales bacterium]